ncbi:MAG: hypothetical protein UX04_C0001G0126 [Microgenomates group bacterium GW2011_GWF2_45_18]|nr:MAG: hypothetical protein UW18_C0003G0104 [Microgenomates group bacterium GW2011_GWF1_44_10]KKU02355.1 MAG: hypothetical protein UX04_C0001G0126 [Microgenomates group bacterium GW2011_GWF2_45_18]OGJ41687.1 MAG: hypothetical protein A2378_02280 [Candidatus Pacebacteria bacterium RIFOXYB1_FULL_44_10]HAU99178.1 hypothetical protein [Candidatus Paceibacterota bacterium]HAX01708.1 hypothetical protein [Candidatus Paceibacterota bacterium]
MIRSFLGPIEIFFSEKRDGDMGEMTVRESFFSKNGITAQKQLILEHGVRVLSSVTRAETWNADAVLFSSESLLECGMIWMTVADCVPVVMWNPSSNMGALVHAGWKSAWKKIHLKTLEQLCPDPNDRADLQVWIGPSIQDCCHKRTANDRMIQDPAWKYAVRYEKGMPFLSLQNGITKALVERKVRSENIQSHGSCTCHLDSRFFSHRRFSTVDQDLRGRMICGVRTDA